LGLSIVREIAHRHHSEIQLLQGDVGTLMRIDFSRVCTPPSVSPAS
jgi:hypothetical protein